MIYSALLDKNCRNQTKEQQCDRENEQECRENHSRKPPSPIKGTSLGWYLVAGSDCDLKRSSRAALFLRKIHDLLLSKTRLGRKRTKQKRTEANYLREKGLTNRRRPDDTLRKMLRLSSLGKNGLVHPHVPRSPRPRKELLPNSHIRKPSRQTGGQTSPKIHAEIKKPIKRTNPIFRSW